MPPLAVPPTEAAREATERAAWAEAAEAFAALDANGASLGPEDLERWGLAAFLVGDYESSDQARERAHHAYVEDDDAKGALRVAHLLGVGLFVRGEVARAGGWFARLASLIEAHGLQNSVWDLALRVSHGMPLIFSGQGPAAVQHFERLRQEAAPLADPELDMLIRNGLGQALVAVGRVSEGLACLDEVMVAATTDQRISPQLVGLMYCAVVETCRICFDVRRAGEWTAQHSRWCSTQAGLVPYLGQCHVHRSELLLLHGACEDAEVEVDRVLALLERHPRDASAALAHYQRGELHSVRGEFSAAEASYARAAQLGHDPQPGLALLRLASGDPGTAAAMLRRAIAEPARAAHDRTRLLRSWVTIALAVGDLPAAIDAARQLRAAAEGQDSQYLAAAAAYASGEVFRTQGKLGEALGQLRRALRDWQQTGAAHDAARCRVALALACRDAGDEESARLDLEAARLTFAEMGAEPDLRRVEELLGARPAAAGRPGALTRRELEILRLLATGDTNRGIARSLFLSEKTVARHVANIFAKLGVGSRSAATAYAYDHRLV